MKKLMGLAMLAGATIAGAGVANAEVSGSVTLTSDYVFRGLSQTNGEAAIQGSFDYSEGIFYAGVWGSSVEFGIDAAMELDAYVGVTPTTGPVSWDLALVGYFYPDGDDAAAGGELDYFEGIVGASIEPAPGFTLGGQLAYSPEFFGETGEGFYYEVNGGYSFSDAFSVSAAWGKQDVDLTGDYDTWNIGGTFAAHGFEFDLRYHDTDISGVDSIVNFTISRSL